ncbi:hypothetical protein ACSVH2_13340 [Flavobacterium sp. RSB2_4_14]|uniref:hypothetical protein n=1 Tax=Flavobacterium sp. RSB2_4_14 TaxID=3447665 RepID=UPI003F30B0F2
MEPKSRRRRIFLALLFLFSVLNFNRMDGNENIRTVQFLSIFAMGILFGLLIREIVEAYKTKQQE